MKENKKGERHCSAEQQNSDVVGRAPAFALHHMKNKTPKCNEGAGKNGFLASTTATKKFDDVGKAPALVPVCCCIPTRRNRGAVKSS